MRSPHVIPATTSANAQCPLSPTLGHLPRARSWGANCSTQQGPHYHQVCPAPEDTAGAVVELEVSGQRAEGREQKRAKLRGRHRVAGGSSGADDGGGDGDGDENPVVGVGVNVNVHVMTKPEGDLIDHESIVTESEMMADVEIRPAAAAEGAGVT